MDDGRRDAAVAARFAGFDQDGNGYISREDFSAAAAALLAAFGARARSARGQELYGAAEGFWQGMAAMADRDGDQRITPGEFTHGAVKRVRDDPGRFAELARPFLSAAHRLADADGDGHLAHEETVRALTALGVAPRTAEECARQLAPGDAGLTVNTLVTGFVRYFVLPD